VLVEARLQLGDRYRSDADAPRVVIVSEPRLGESMNLPSSHEEVWTVLETTARQIARQCDFYAVACNTLNVYSDEIATLGLEAELVSFQSVVTDWLGDNEIDEAALLGARPVMELGEWSPYRRLAEAIDIEVPAVLGDVHRLIDEIKASGPRLEGHSDALAAIVEKLNSPVVLLACTELPLVVPSLPARELVDVNQLVAGALIRRANDRN